MNTNRLNLHIIPIIEHNGGCMIVDSTKKGKIFPDRHAYIKKRRP